jgi:citrate lyase synthetase
MVPREMDQEKRNRYPLADDVIVLPEADIAMSSTKVRQCLKDKNFKQLEHDLHPNTLKYLIGI